MQAIEQHHESADRYELFTGHKSTEFTLISKAWLR